MATGKKPFRPTTTPAPKPKSRSAPLPGPVSGLPGAVRTGTIPGPVRGPGPGTFHGVPGSNRSKPKSQSQNVAPGFIPNAKPKPKPVNPRAYNPANPATRVRTPLKPGGAKPIVKPVPTAPVVVKKKPKSGY